VLIAFIGSFAPLHRRYSQNAPNKTRCSEARSVLPDFIGLVVLRELRNHWHLRKSNQPDHFQETRPL
jgi:hypothetical protein